MQNKSSPNQNVSSPFLGRWLLVASIWLCVALKYGKNLDIKFTEKTCNSNQIMIIFAGNLAINEKSQFERMD
jgi:hypothetical protein